MALGQDALKSHKHNVRIGLLTDLPLYIISNQIILPCINVCTELPAKNRFRLD